MTTAMDELPTDWQTKPLGDLGRVVRGGSPRPAGDPRYFNGSFIPWLTVASLTAIPASQIRVSETAGCLTEEGANRSRTLPPSTLVLANSGATLGVAKILDLQCCANDGIAALIDQHTGNREFICQYLNTRTEYLRDVVAPGNGQPNLNTSLIKAIEVPFPPEPEQEAIAEVLGDVDDLITKLVRLIAKKRDVKQGMMQELLTGRTRLPGYSVGWELSAFDEIMEVVNTRGSQVDANKYCEVGTFPVVDQGKEFIAGYVGSEHSPISPGVEGVFVFGDHTTISKYVDFDFVVGADGTKVLRSRSSSNYVSRYICYCLELYPVSPTGYNRHFGKLRERQFLLPRAEEQRAIAKILQDADAELAALEQRLESARAVKLGMMQELLTGRRRLPAKEEV